MTPEEFRVAAKELVDWIADYRLGLAERPVGARTQPGEVAAMLPSSPPPGGADMAEMLGLVDDVVVPNLTLTQHPMFYGWFPGNASLSSVLGDIAASGLAGLGISWESAPALTDVEVVVCDWLRQLVGLSDRWSGTLVDSASTATFTAALAARERATGLGERSGGLVAETAPLRVYTTSEAHSSVRKAALLAGFGGDNVVEVATDSQCAMDPADLSRRMAADRANGARPAMVVTVAGSTAVTAFDPQAAIASAIDDDHDRHGGPRPWMHVDAAMGGTAMFLPEFRALWDGVERADSVVWNPHKWMGTVLDCSVMHVAEPTDLTDVFGTSPAYLRSAADGEVVQYRDWGIPLGRRFRALKVWFQLGIDGPQEIAARVRRDVDNAQWLGAQVEASDDFELIQPVRLQTVCLRPVVARGVDRDGLTQKLAADLNRSGTAFVTPALLDDGWFIRVSVGSLDTDRAAVVRLWSGLSGMMSKAGE